MASSMTLSPCLCAMRTSLSMSAGWPNMWVTTMARVKGVMSFSALSGSAHNELLSMSVKTGAAPVSAHVVSVSAEP